MARVSKEQELNYWLHW